MKIEVKLGNENQLTLPDEVVSRLKLTPGDPLLVEIDETDPFRVQIRPDLRSYAGILNGMWGTDEEALEYVRNERASWDQ